jgi:hypothetical protein
VNTSPDRVRWPALLCWLAACGLAAAAVPERVEVSDLAAFAEAAAGNGRHIVLEPGVYRMADYLTDEVLEGIRAGVDRTLRRPPVPMLVIAGDRNTFDLRGVTFEIDTSLYRKLPGGGYIRCLIVAGNGNVLDGLSIRNTGPEQGSNGNILSVAGESNTLVNVTLAVRGSSPYGYGDLLGKGGPNLVGLQKQSGIQVLGTGTVLRRCRVFSRAFGHCFYIQGGNDIRLEDCYAEGAMRPTAAMLRDREGPAYDLNFRSVYENRDGRYRITPGYMKSLVEDGFRTYGNAGNVTLLNCTAIHTRAGFEIGARDDSPKKTIVENCVARGCERAYLLGSHVIVRRSRGDADYGPLLYLRGGREADVELELTGAGSDYTVHALATIAGENHRVRLTADPAAPPRPALPILFGFGMPAHAEMASPIRPAPTRNITLENAIPSAPIITAEEIPDCTIQSDGPVIPDADTKASPGNWG